MSGYSNASLLRDHPAEWEPHDIQPLQVERQVVLAGFAGQPLDKKTRQRTQNRPTALPEKHSGLL
jgi:hypothetical protein